MIDKIGNIKIEYEDGTISNPIPIGGKAKNIEMDNGETAENEINKKPYYYNTIIDMKADAKLKVGDMAVTLGYNNINDGGAAEYLIIERNQAYTTDEIYLVSMTNDNIVALLRDPNVFTNQVKYTEFYDEEDESTYYITEIPYKNFLGEQNVWQLGIAEDNTETLNSLERTIDFANRVGATVAINAGIFAINSTHRPWGVLIKDGEVLKDEVYTNLTSETLGIKPDGTFETFNSATATAQEILDAGCINATCAFTTIIKNGVAIPKSSTSKGPRQIIAQKANKDYIILTASGRLLKTPGLTVQRAQQILLNNYNVVFAYELDGGGSTSTVINGQKINENIDNLCEDRHVSNFLYMGKPKNINKDLKNIYALVSNLRQDMISNFTNLRDIWYGYLFLRGPENSSTPGIEFFQNGERETRSGKIHLNTDGFYIRQRPNLESNERFLFKATNDGLYWNDLKLGNYFEYGVGYEEGQDLNDLEENGFYLCTPYTINRPQSSGNFIILHFNTGYTKNNRVQIAFPAKDTNGYIYSRRLVAGQTKYTDWAPIGGYISSTTANRPTTNLRKGQIYFDETLGKPIWYNGTNWVDATGTQV